MSDLADEIYEATGMILGTQQAAAMTAFVRAREAAAEIEWLRGERNRLAADLAKAHLDIVAWIKKAQEAYRD